MGPSFGVLQLRALLIRVRPLILGTPLILGSPYLLGCSVDLESAHSIPI